MNVLMVSTAMVGSIWSRVEHMLGPAIHLFNGYNAYDVYHDLMAGKTILWIATNDDRKIIAAMVAQIVQYPRKRTCLIRYVGGEKGNDWSKLMSEVEQWAAKLGCNDIEFVARHGWSKLLTGFESPVRLYTKSLGGA